MTCKRHECYFKKIQNSDQELKKRYEKGLKTKFDINKKELKVGHEEGLKIRS